MWDIIGDIHGEATKLRALLQVLGYQEKEKYFYEHPTRKVCFLGDYIDRGPQILESLSIVQTMTQRKSASALMGNHEFNYLAFITERKQLLKHRLGKSEPVYVRHHNKRHRKEIDKTQKLFQELPDQGASLIKWFYSLPIYLETSQFRAIHAIWEDSAIDTLKKSPLIVRKKYLTKEFIANFHNNLSTREAIALILKGITIDLPPGVKFRDYQGDERDYARLAWWQTSALKNGTISQEDLSHLLIMKKSEAKRIAKLLTENHIKAILQGLPSYPAKSKPLFIGHYWLEQENIEVFNDTLRRGSCPYLLLPNLCCLDFSAAQGGPLVAYRFNGEKVLSEKSFVWV